MPLNEKLRKRWKDAGYDRGHGSDAVLPPPEAGFERLYYLTTPEHAISNVVFGRVKVSRFSELNDPFELFAQSFAKSENRKLLRAYRKDLNEKKGLICFSRDWTDPVLWSHYAAKHKGVAMGFDVSSSLVKEIKYSPKRLKEKLPVEENSIAPELAELLTYTKFESWSYEREWRALHELKDTKKEGNLYFVPFSEDMKLVEFILGSLCELNLKRLRQIIDSAYPGVMTYKARLAYRSFRIIPQGTSVILQV